MAVAAMGTGAAMMYKYNKDYYKKYPILPEYRTWFRITMPSVLINKRCMDLINKDFEKHIIKPDGVKMTTRRIPTYDGSEMLLCIMEPEDVKPDEVLPCLVYYHGSGFVVEAFSSFYETTSEYVKQARCKLVFVNYRTLYKATADACFEDAYTGFVWTYENAEMLHIDKDRIAVAGDSAGGTLTAAVSHMTRDRKGPKILFTMFIYPVTDASMTSDSMKNFKDVPGWNPKANKKMWSELKKSLSPSMLKYASPLSNDDFTGLCDAYVEVEQFDCLHDEGVKYAEKLMENGYQVELNDVKGTFHGFDEKKDKIFGKQILELRSQRLRKVFEQKNQEFDKDN